MKRTCALLVVAAAIIALLALTAGPTASAQPAPPPMPMPQSGTFIADMPMNDGKTMTLGVAVTGDQVAAYTTDGATMMAWFFGTQANGVMDLTSMYQDRLTARFDGVKLDGTITMNMPDNQPHQFAAAAVQAPAGIYTATMGDARATWVVRPDQTQVGMMMPNSRQDREVIDAINKQQQDYMDQIRRMRLQQQMQQTTQLNVSTGQAMMNGQAMTAQPVNGATRF